MRRRDRALIHDRGAGIARLGKAIAAFSEIVVAEIGSCCEQRTHIHLRTMTEHDAVRIDQPDIAVGEQLPVDCRCVGTGHAIDGERRGVRLIEGDRRSRRHREAVPVDQRLLARLIDDSLRRTGCRDRRASDDDLAARRTSGQRPGRCEHGRRDKRACRQKH